MEKRVQLSPDALAKKAATIYKKILQHLQSAGVADNLGSKANQFDDSDQIL